MHLVNCDSRAMSHTDSCKEEDNELLEDWTLVEFQNNTQIEEDEQDDEESREGAVTPPEEEEEIEVAEEEVEEEEEENEGQKVEDVKGDEESSEKRLRKRKVDKTEEKDLKEIEAAETSEDALQKRTDVSTPEEDMNKRLNRIVIVVLVLVSLFGLAHFIGIVDLSEDGVEPGWSSRSLWEENLNAAQILEKLKYENEELQEKILKLQAENTEPFKIKGREGKEGRSLREKVNHLIMENEDLRLALSRHQFSLLPDGDKTEFNKASQENHHFRTTVQQLKHLVPDVNKLELSLESLKNEHKELLKTVGNIRHQETIPKELTPLIKQLEEMRSVVAAEAKKKNPPPTIYNARSYLAYMTQVLSAFTFLHEMEGKSASEKIDFAKDIFSYWMPKGIKVPPKLQDDVIMARNNFNAVKTSIRKKWKQLKDLTKPETIVEVGQSTVAKMNRVIVNVVNKLKDIGQSTIMSTNKQLEQSVLSFSTGLSKLNKQFDETWKSLEIRVSMGDRGEDGIEDDEDDYDGEEGAEEKEAADSGYDDEDVDEENDEDEDDEEEDIIEDENDQDDEDEIKEIKKRGKDVVADKIKHKKKEEEKRKAPTKQPDTKSKSQPDKHRTSSLENVEIREEIQKQLKDKEFENIRGKIDSKSEFNKKRKVQPNRKDQRQNQKHSGKEKVDHRQKEKSLKYQEPRDHRKDSKSSLKDKIREKKKEQKLPKEDSRYFKGQYNKFDKVKDGEEREVPDFTKKYYPHSEDDEDDDDDYDSNVPKKATGLKRHWEKPQKKNYFREQSGPKKQFIRRRGDF